MKTHTNGIETQSGNAITIPGTKITTRWEYVTPAIAAAYRAKTRRNRRRMESLAQRYAKDMAAGQWLMTHQGVAFDENDDLIDSQHRLEAIEISGAPQWLLVTRGLPLGSAEAMDRGRARSLAHSLQILGFQHSDSKIVAMARMMLYGPVTVQAKDRPTDITMRKFIEAHQEAILVVAEIPGRTKMPAPVTGALCRATYHTTAARLVRFVAAYHDEIPRDDSAAGDKTARLLQKAVERDRFAGGLRTQLYRKAQNAVQCYLSGEDLQRLHECPKDLFPLPELQAEGTP